MHAIDHFRRPRPESVLTTPELPAIAVPTMFIWGATPPTSRRPRPALDRPDPERRFTRCPADTAHGSWTPNAARELIQTHLTTVAATAP